MYWANKQVKYKLSSRDPNYKMKCIGNVKHSIGNEPSFIHSSGYSYYKFGLLHNSHGPSQIITNLSKNTIVTVWHKYGFTNRRVFTGNINLEYKYEYGLRHDEYYTHGVYNVETDVCASLNNNTDMIIRLIEIMSEMEKQIIELNFNGITYNKHSGALGDKYDSTYTTSETDIVFMRNGVIHRDYGLPAVVFKNCMCMYVRNGIIDRFMGW